MVFKWFIFFVLGCVYVFEMILMWKSVLSWCFDVEIWIEGFDVIVIR